MSRTRNLAVVVIALLLVAGCGGSDNASVDKLKPAPTGDCQASGSGTTDLKAKPKVDVPAGTAPTETTAIEIVCGTGKEAKPGSAVEVKYVGALYKGGTEFDSSWSRGADETLPFTVGSGVIPGFSKGATGMREGGRREVVIPSKDGYGPEGTGPIPGGATLIFVIDLAKVS